MLAEISVSLERIKCFHYRKASKAGFSKPLVVTLDTADSVITIFQNKIRLDLVIKRHRTTQESI